MRLVDNEHRVRFTRQRVEIIDRRNIAFHGVKALDGNPNAPGATVRPPSRDALAKSLDVVMRRAHRCRLAHAHAVVRAGVDQVVMNDEIAPLRQRCEDRRVRCEPAAHVERRLGTEEPRRLVLQRLVFRIVPAQQPRTTGADRHTPRQVLRRSPPQVPATIQAPDSRWKKSRSPAGARARAGVPARPAPSVRARGLRACRPLRARNRARGFA